MWQQPGTGWGKYPQLSPSTRQWVLTVPPFCLRGEAYDMNQVASPGEWASEKALKGEGVVPKGEVPSPWTSCLMALFLQFPWCDGLMAGNKQHRPSIYHFFILLHVICPDSKADLKTWSLLPLRLWRIWLKRTQPNSHFALGPETTRGHLLMHSFPLCFWSALNVFLVTNRPWGHI